MVDAFICGGIAGIGKKDLKYEAVICSTKNYHTLWFRPTSS